MRFSVSLRVGLLGAAGTLWPSVAASTQDLPVAFVHGFRGGSGTWLATSNTLAAQLQIAPILMTLPWSQAFSTQATSLNSFVSSLANIPGVAYSNGGLVTREHRRLFPGRLNRIATVGSPHLGAPIADNFENGTVNTFVSSLVGDILTALNFYLENDSYFQVLIQSTPYNFDVILVTACCLVRRSRRRSYRLFPARLTAPCIPISARTRPFSRRLTDRRTRAPRQQSAKSLSVPKRRLTERSQSSFPLSQNR